MLSDSESSDSDTGRRYKTESTRAKEDVSLKKRAKDDDLDDRYDRRNARYDYSREHIKSRSRSPEYRRKRDRSRSRSRGDRQEYSSRDSGRGTSSSTARRKYDSYEKQSKHRDLDEHKHNDRTTKESDSSQQCSSTKSSTKSKAKPDRDDEKNHHRNESSNGHTEKVKKHKKDKEPKRHREERSSKHSNHTSQADKKLDEATPSLPPPPPPPAPALASAPPVALPTVIAEPESSNGKDEEKPTTSNSDENLICGPSLPPHMMTTNKPAIDPKLPSPSQKRNYGPSLPADLNLLTSESNDDPKMDSAIMDISDSEDDDFVGPTPIDSISKKSEAYLELEKRALELKIAKLNEKERNTQNPIKEREEWMTELPDIRTVSDLGLKARQFRAKERDEIKDRTGWTDTPRDREEKSKRKEPTQDELIDLRNRKAAKLYRERRDAEQEAAIKKHKKKHKRDQSLLELHQKNLKKQSKDSKKDDERRPFSRDTDLQVNRFDEAQKKSIIKKAQLLDTRFSSGQSKFL